MPKACAERFLLLLAGSLLLAGCASHDPGPKPTVLPGVAQEKAILSGAQALADFRREAVLAQAEKRAANYPPIRARLAQAVQVFQPTGNSFPTAANMPASLALTSALAAADRIIEAEARQDTFGASVGWELLDLSLLDLAAALGPRASPRLFDSGPREQPVEPLLPAIPVLGPEHDGKTVTLVNVSEVRIQLPGDPSGAWVINNLKPLSPNLRMKVLSEPKAIPDKPGTILAAVGLMGMGKAEVSLDFKRPDLPTEKTFRVTLDIREAPPGTINL